jgi:YHS domain-containing protein
MKLININIRNRTFLLLIALAGVAVAFIACGKTAGVEAINKTADGLAVRGFDTVAFFAEQSAFQGNPTYGYVWNGAKWLFSTPENLEKFKKSPEAYAPQFGGYCSYAVSHGYTADGDPQAWKIVDGKLFLNYNQKTKETWEKEQDRFIKQGEQNWLEFQKKKPEHKG